MKKYIKKLVKKLKPAKNTVVSNANETVSAPETPTQKADANLNFVCNETKWDPKFAAEKIAQATSLGMSIKNYIKYSCWDLTDDEIKEFVDILAGQKKQLADDKNWYIDLVCEKTNMSRDEVIADMAECKKLGISAIKYVQKACYNRSESGRNALAPAMKRDKVRINNNKNIYVDKVCSITGWTPGKAQLEINRAKLLTGASYEDYLVFKMYELTPEEQVTYVTYGHFSKMRLKYNNYFKGRKFFDDKAMFNKTFSDCIKRKWFVNTDLSYEDFLSNIEGLDAVLVKPLTATQGIGIQKFDCTVEDKQALYNEIISLPASIVEQYIIQHEEVMKFCDTSVNTLRITTLNYNGECKFLYSVFRMGQGNVVDNFHSGGIAATVDVNTGIVVTHAADLDANVYPTNPYSGLAMKGFKIPNWDQIIETCQKAYNKVSGVNLIGWDFAITPDGVDLIEGNPGASYVVAQIPNVADKIGIRNTMVDPYL